ncbi:MAG: hypothetical protein LBF88_01875 [Planctomycetaceae bacterium]|jgi:hypothetical protein|nr:hypothetical protein [Planctomycetaceae bacterium]
MNAYRLSSAEISRLKLLPKTFINYYRWLRFRSGKDAVFLFGDATHPTHPSIPAYGWIRKGRESPLQANSGRQRVNINRSYDCYKRY